MIIRTHGGRRRPLSGAVTLCYGCSCPRSRPSGLPAQDAGPEGVPFIFETWQGTLERLVLGALIGSCFPSLCAGLPRRACRLGVSGVGEGM